MSNASIDRHTSVHAHSPTSTTPVSHTSVPGAHLSAGPLARSPMILARPLACSRRDLCNDIDRHSLLAVSYPDSYSSAKKGVCWLNELVIKSQANDRRRRFLDVLI
ncbi:hypothetical protein CY34DRAFT_717870 [Suillus luteus UH-Slu-Lm8-n1]|uniref:Uncharacterized protein n=1 Tax=Suillus luteus UH-Slu-Lm8-n1 TaxID=930992 RepID=A0A0C9ZV72_9AGAM|nr:hypothetical protein CY34DRAFT_717870 [Suillus luteus UH-Slu-Lm8-n1]